MRITTSILAALACIAFISAIAAYFLHERGSDAVAGEVGDPHPSHEREVAVDPGMLASAPSTTGFDPGERKASRAGFVSSGPRSERELATRIVELLIEGEEGRIQPRVQRVRVSELLDEIYIRYRSRIAAGAPLPEASRARVLSPDDRQLLARLASVRARNPEIMGELERRIEEYDLKMNCESVEEVFQVWLSGS